MGVKRVPAKFKSNPFLEQTAQYKRGHRRTVVDGNKAITDTQTGEVLSCAEIVQVENVDADQFVKLYTADLKRLFSLTPSSYRLLGVLLEQVQHNQESDTVTLNIPLVLDYFERNPILSETGKLLNPPVRQSIHRSIDEMIKKGFIAKMEFQADGYFINTNLFFNGNRVRLVKEYQIKRQESLVLDYKKEGEND
ncbi:MAG: hypothetical protein HQL35_15805 [Alphaproteobacteria bacterium]|nr:hypothetical protein [Alphaproteobacteria bacterium]